MSPTAALACPRCLKTAGLWEGVDVPGWRSIEAKIDGDGKHHLSEPGLGARSDREAMWGPDVQSRGELGCSECRWEGTASELVQLDIEGQPLAAPLPGQQVIA